MRVRSSSGVEVQRMSEYASEFEVLFRPGTEFEIAGKAWDPVQQRWEIDLAEVHGPSHLRQYSNGSETAVPTAVPAHADEPAAGSAPHDTDPFAMPADPDAVTSTGTPSGPALYVDGGEVLPFERAHNTYLQHAMYDALRNPSDWSPTSAERELHSRLERVDHWQLRSDGRSYTAMDNNGSTLGIYRPAADEPWGEKALVGGDVWARAAVAYRLSVAMDLQVATPTVAVRGPRGIGSFEMVPTRSTGLEPDPELAMHRRAALNYLLGTEHLSLRGGVAKDLGIGSFPEVTRKLMSDDVADLVGKPLRQEVLAGLRRVSTQELAVLMRNADVGMDGTRGFVARLDELKAGRITGEAVGWNVTDKYGAIPRRLLHEMEIANGFVGRVEPTASVGPTYLHQARSIAGDLWKNHPVETMAAVGAVGLPAEWAALDAYDDMRDEQRRERQAAAEEAARRAAEEAEEAAWRAEADRLARQKEDLLSGRLPRDEQLRLMAQEPQWGAAIDGVPRFLRPAGDLVPPGFADLVYIDGSKESRRAAESLHKLPEEFRRVLLRHQWDEEITTRLANDRTFAKLIPEFEWSGPDPRGIYIHGSVIGASANWPKDSQGVPDVIQMEYTTLHESMHAIDDALGASQAGDHVDMVRSLPREVAKNYRIGWGKAYKREEMDEMLFAETFAMAGSAWAYYRDAPEEDRWYQIGVALTDRLETLPSWQVREKIGRAYDDYFQHLSREIS